MRIEAGSSDQEYILEFSSGEEYETFFSEVDREGTFLLDLENAPENLVIRARVAGTSRARTIRPVTVAKEGCQYRIFVRDLQPSATKDDQDPEINMQSVHLRIREMSITERATLAMKANRTERRVLMQQNNLKINEFLLRNNRITEEELAWMAHSPASPMATILTIAGNTNWMHLQMVRIGILTNPRTPAAMILKWIPLLSAGDLIKMHHARNLRDDVRETVEREIRKRKIRIQ